MNAADFHQHLAPFHSADFGCSHRPGSSVPPVPADRLWCRSWLPSGERPKHSVVVLALDSLVRARVDVTIAAGLLHLMPILPPTPDGLPWSV